MGVNQELNVDLLNFKLTNTTWNFTVVHQPVMLSKALQNKIIMWRSITKESTRLVAGKVTQKNTLNIASVLWTSQ
jgi:hypothetical protein